MIQECLFWEIKEYLFKIQTRMLKNGLKKINKNSKIFLSPTILMLLLYLNKSKIARIEKKKKTNFKKLLQ